MGNYCIIPENREQFFSWLTQVEIGEPGLSYVRRCHVLRVVVDAAQASWTIHLRGPAEMPAEIKQALAAAISLGCGLRQVRFHTEIITVEDYIDKQWTDLVNRVAPPQPGVRHVLSRAAVKYTGAELRIALPADITAELLEGAEISTAIEQLLRQDFGVDCPVVYDIAADAANALEEDVCPVVEVVVAARSDKGNGSGGKDNVVLYGRPIREEPRPMSEIVDEELAVVVEGKVIKAEARELRSKRTLITFDVGDLNGGIACKLFLENAEEISQVMDGLKHGYVRVKGKVQEDSFSRELTLQVQHLQKAFREQRQDQAEVKRVELHAHTQMSTLDGMVSAKELIQTAARWGHPAIAITDHGVVQAFPDAYEVAAKNKIKLIYGMEAYLVEEELDRSCHLIILAENEIGLRNLYRLVSLSHLNYYHRTPRVPRRVLQEHREGLILGSACEAGELIRAMLAGAGDEELLNIARFYDYLEIQPIHNNAFLVREGKIASDEGLRDLNRKVCELGERLGKPVVATCDVHFLNPEDEVYRRILMAGKGFSDADEQPPLYFRTTEEMLREFAYLGAGKAQEVVISNPVQICDRIQSFKPIPDELYSPQIPGADDDVRNMAWRKAHALYGDEVPELVAKRLQSELDSIINNGFAVLYLIAHKLVKKSLDDGYLVGSRGSVGSSFVATMIDITEVNPLPPHWRCTQCRHSEFVTDGSYGGGYDLPDKDCPHCAIPMTKDGHDIPFAVFMGFNGDKVPDIDLNFSGDYQPVAHKYTEELFGKDNVFRAGTIATIADKTAYGFVKNYYEERKGEQGGTIRQAHINSLVSGCTGVKRTTGQHPGGIMVVPRDMDVHYFTPVQRPADDKNSSTITTHFDYHSISSRLVKLDILGHDDPTVIKMLEDLTEEDPRKFPFDDPATMSLFSSTTALGVSAKELGSTVGTFGIPEFGTKFVRQMLEDTKPKTFSELVRISGFSHGTDVWLNNAQDLIRAGTAKLSEAISARDDIMVYLMQKGVEPLTAFKVMEDVRKGKGVKADYVEKLKAQQVPDWYVESCQKIKYMFPKAHAVAYVMMAFRIAYCKIHHPLAFYASYFTVRATEFDADLIVQGPQALRAKLEEFERAPSLTAKDKGLQTIVEMALEMYLRQFTLQRVDLYRSAAQRFLIVGERELLPPLASLQGVGDAAAQNIVLAREERPFSSMEDLRNRARVSKTVIDTLRAHGALGDMQETDQMMLFA